MRALAAIRVGDGQLVYLVGPGGALEVLARPRLAAGERVTDPSGRALSEEELPFDAARAGRAYPARALTVWRDGTEANVMAEVVRPRRAGQSGEGHEADVSLLIVEPRVEDEPTARERFVTIATHELKSPIASLQLDLERIRRRLFASGSVSGPEIAKNMDRALRQVSRLTLLIQNLLDVSRMQAQTFQLSREAEEGNLCTVVSDLVEMIEPQVRAAGCEVTLTTCENIPGIWDQLRIEQVIHNLVTNAVKYARAGKRIDVGVARDPHRPVARISVRDYGPGIPEDERARVFEPFQRGRTAGDSVATHSLGLGLYIVREIVAAHRGEIHIESPEGGGACFAVELPIQKPVTEETQADGREEEASERPTRP